MSLKYEPSSEPLHIEQGPVAGPLCALECFLWGVWGLGLGVRG